MLRMLKKNLASFGIAAVLLCLFALIYYSDEISLLNKPNLPEVIQSESDATDTLNHQSIFPLLIHQTWKSKKTPLTSDLSKWISGCKAVNSQFKFTLFDDSDLVEFVNVNYPEYYTMFRSLHGVYMADMARLLLIYHYGGIYMDTDFYCRRPFKCLIDQTMNYIHSNQKFNEVMNKTKLDILVVSQEPFTHSVLFRKKERVIIQDFFLATEKHPFFKWLLDFYNDKYLADMSHPMKGPFSYSIENDIDAYRKAVFNQSYTTLSLNDLKIPSEVNISETRRLEVESKTSRIFASDSELSISNDKGLILELLPHILHPLIDSSNMRLYSVCRESNLSEHQQQICQKVSKSIFFEPDTFNTIAVHMWTHIYLGWNFIRSFYNWRVYRNVETTLPSLTHCN